MEKVPTMAFLFVPFFILWMNQEDGAFGRKPDDILMTFLKSEFFRRESIATNFFRLAMMGIQGPSKLKRQIQACLEEIHKFFDPEKISKNGYRYLTKSLSYVVSDVDTKLDNKCEFVSRYFRNVLLAPFTQRSVDRNVANRILFGITDDRSLFHKCKREDRAEWQFLPGKTWNCFDDDDVESLKRKVAEIATCGIHLGKFARRVQKAREVEGFPVAVNLVDIDEMVALAFDDDQSFALDGCLYKGDMQPFGGIPSPKTLKELLTFFVAGVVSIAQSQKDWRWNALQQDSFGKRLADFRESASREPQSLEDFFRKALKGNVGLPIYFLACCLSYIYPATKKSTKLSKSFLSVSFFALRIKRPFIAAYKRLQDSKHYKTKFIKYESNTAFGGERKEAEGRQIVSARDFQPREVEMDI